ncbi:hypothetical protein CLK_3775 [Clostridium botulinum A3 str. Loch Maree]|nr:hypothetical protein CLK_3775 [Clostridium botulinum A3 str. Loch Maree]
MFIIIPSLKIYIYIIAFFAILIAVLTIKIVKIIYIIYYRFGFHH